MSFRVFRLFVSHLCVSINVKPLVLNGKKFPSCLRLKLFMLFCKTQLEEHEMFHFPPEFISQVVFDAKLPEVWGFLFCFPVSLFLNNLLLSLVFYLHTF